MESTNERESASVERSDPRGAFDGCSATAAGGRAVERPGVVASIRDGTVDRDVAAGGRP